MVGFHIQKVSPALAFISAADEPCVRGAGQGKVQAGGEGRGETREVGGGGAMAVVIKALANPVSAQDRRQHLRVIDACLAHLEDAQERNEALVSDALAVRLRPFVDGIEPGQRIATAIEKALHQQEPYLLSARYRGRRDESLTTSPGTSEPRRTRAEPEDTGGDREAEGVRLEADDARNLTARIKMAVTGVARLLLDAHDGRAWSALGYPSWGEYVSREFGFTRQRSFQLLDHARFLRALEGATGESTAVDVVSERASRDLKPYRHAVLEAVRIRAVGASENELPGVVRSAVEEHRNRVVHHSSAGERRLSSRLLPSERRDDSAVRSWDLEGSLSRLCDAIDILTHMPPADELVGALVPPSLGHRLVGASEAARWLTAFARGCESSSTPIAGTLRT